MWTILNYTCEVQKRNIHRLVEILWKDYVRKKAILARVGRVQ